MKKKKQIKKLDLNLFPEEFVNKEIYEQKKNEYVLKYTVYERGYPTGFLGWREGRDVPRPDVGEYEWAKMYPNGYESWANQQRKLSARGQQNVIDKVNEIIAFLNTSTE
jgi:hypothetical protein